MRLKGQTLLDNALMNLTYPELIGVRALRGPEAALARWRELYAADRGRILAERTPPRTRATFTFRGQTLSYLDRDYNTTRINERTVEVPVVLDELSRLPGGTVLEVGNVLRHYAPVTHPVVDKYERGPNVLNLDVVTDELPGPNDLVVSISTFEHIGWDYPPRTPGRFPRAVQRVLQSLAPQGRFFGTVPLGYNVGIDRFVARPETLGVRLWFMRRTTASNEWQECSLTETDRRYVQHIRPYARGWRRGPPYPFANSLCFFEMDARAIPLFSRMI